MPASLLAGDISAVATVSALTGNVVQSLLIVFTLVLSEARLTIKQRCPAVLGAFVLVTVLFCIDLPLVLIGAVDELLREQTVAVRWGASDLALRQRARWWRTPGFGRVGCLGAHRVSGA